MQIAIGRTFFRRCLAACLWIAATFGLAGIAQAQVPSAPTGLSPVGVPYPDTTTSVTLSWNPTPGATFYAIRANDQTEMGNRVPGNNCPGDPHYLCVNGIGSNSWTLPVAPGHSYGWWVHACNAYGCGAQSDGALVLSVAPPTGMQSQCSPDGTSVTVSWSPMTGATGYGPRLNYTPNDSPSCFDNWLCPGGQDQYGEVGTASYTASIVPGALYNTWVHGINAAGYGTASSTSFICQPAAPAVSFPPFSTVRTDYINPYEGLWFSPLQIASPLCVYLPQVYWQDWLCTGSQSMPAIYGQTNSFSNASDPYFSWIIVMNNEPIQNQGCNTGPPNQSRPVNQFGSPFKLAYSASSLKIEVQHDSNTTCLKIPYMSASYTRGVQPGDPQTRMLSWSEMAGRNLVIDVDIQKQTVPLNWFKVLTHFRNPANGERYFINTNYVRPDDDTNVLINWNWPFRNSFQFPGARILIPAGTMAQSLPNGFNRIIIPLQGHWLAHPNAPAGVTPDFLGVEVSVEIGEFGTGVSAEIKAVSIQ